MKKILYASLFCIIAAAIVPTFSSCDRSAPYRNSDGAVWNTLFHITYSSPIELDDSIHEVMKRVEMSLSAFNDSSLVSRINRNETTTVDSSFIRVFRTSAYVNSLSKGAFDPTAAPLIELWGFGKTDQGNNIPDKAEIDSVLNYVGLADCYLTGDTLTKKSEFTTFNFSAVAKGFGCDEIAAMFHRNDCHNFMIEIGGEVVVSGKNSYGEDWNITIESPFDAITGKRSYMMTIPLTDCGIATSGNYRNFRDTGTHRFGHTINPVKGYPVTTSTLSATIIAPDCTLADALATTCMVLPSSEAIEMIDSLEGIEYLIIIRHNTGELECIFSEGLNF